MMTRLKQWLACLLSAALLVSALPAGALAERQVVASEAVDLSGAFAPQRAAQEYPLDGGAFNLSAELTIDGKTPDENTVIHDGTTFNVRLEWELPAGETYTPEDAFTYTLPDAIPATNRSGSIANAGGEEIGTFSIDGRKVTVRYFQDFLNEGDRTGWLNINGQFNLDDIQTGTGSIVIELPGGVRYEVAVESDGGLKIEKAAEKRVNNGAHKVYIDYTLTAIRRNTNVKIEDVITAAMNEQSKNGNIVSWTLKDVSCAGCKVEGFASAADNRTASGAIAEMPEGSSVTIQYTIEVNCVGATADVATIYSNEATASSDQTTPVQAERHVSVLPVAIGKRGTLGGDGKTITWEIEVLAGEFDSVVVQETEFDASLQTAGDDTVVTVAHDGGATEKTTLGALKAGYTLANQPKGALHKLTFQTELKDGVTANGVENKAAVQAPSVEAQAYVTIAQADLWKQMAAHDIGQDRIDWKTTFDLRSDVASVTFEDYVDSGAGDNAELQHALDAGSVRLELDGEDITSSAQVSTEDGRVKVAVQGAKAGRYILYCSTKYVRPMAENTQGEKTLVNHASYDIGSDGTRDGVTTAKWTLPLNYISKNASAIDGGNVEWTVTFNEEVPVGYRDVTVTDTLPEGLEFVSAAFDGAPVEPSVQGRELTFALTDANLDKALVIQTRVTDYTQLKEALALVNAAQLFVGDAAYPTVTAQATVTPPDVATKGQVYTQETHPLVHYTISINPNALDLIPEGAEQTFTLTDEIGPALRFEQDTLTVNGSAWEGGVEFAGNTMRIHGLKDETAYEIKYDARIVLDSGTDFDGDGWNQVDISPIGIPGGNQSSTELTGEVLEATAGGESKTLKVSIFKKDDSGNPVQGATFTLYSYGTGAEPNGSGEEVAQLTSGENGETEPFEVTFDTIYRFVETGVPAGYELGDSELPYFVRPSKGSSTQYGAGVEVLTGYQEYEFEAVNPKLKTGSLSIEKKLAEGAPDNAFTFKVTVDGQPYAGAYAVGDAQLQAADGKITLRGGETAVIAGLAAGSAYAIEEIDLPKGYANTASQNSSGAITAGATQYASFTNAYAATGAWTPSGAKVLNGRDMLDGEAFAFTLNEQDGGYADTASVTGAKDGVRTEFSFDAIEYTLADVGRHVYAIAEQGADENGLTCDKSVYTVTVDVSDNGDGTLKVESKVTLNGEEAPDGALFTNAYLPEPATYAPTVAKVIEGGARPEEKEFVFALEKDGDSAAEATVTGEGTAQFGAITFREAGTYRFILREKAGGEPGYTYDQGYWLLEVDVVDDLQGALSVTAHDYTYFSGGQPTQTTATDHATFTNRYDVTGTRWTPAVRKRVEGEAMPADGEFTFALTAAEQEGMALPQAASAQITVDAQNPAGAASFGAIQFRRAGKYTFEIREVIPEDQDPSVTYDDAVWTLTVAVKDAGGKLEIERAVYESDGVQATDAATFANVYTPAETAYAPQVRKALTGQAAPEAATFAFTLTADPENPEGASLGGAETSVTGAGTAAFEPIRFARAGSYAFAIAEADGGKTGYTYDEHIWTLRVDVADEGGALKVESAAYVREDGAQADAAEFTNHYEPLPATVELLGEKRVDGTPQAQETFRFELTAQEAGSPMPEGSEENTATVTVTGAGAFGFGEMRFPAPGVYAYAVRELPGGALGYAYDGSVYAVTVEITDAGGALASQVRYAKDEEASDRALFVNRYETGTLTISKTVTGDGADRDRAFAFEATLLDADGTPLAGTYPCTWAGGSAAGVVENGKAAFSLAHGQSLTIHDLPVGAAYRVVETEHSGYTPSCASAEGQIVLGEARADYVNARNQNTAIPKTGYGEDIGRYALLAGCLATALLAGIGRKMLKPARRKHRR